MGAGLAGGPGGSGYMYKSWFTLWYSRNQQNIVKNILILQAKGSCPQSLQVEECLPDLDVLLLHPFLRAFVPSHNPSFVMLKGKKPKKSLERFFWVSLLSETAEAFWPLGVSFEGVEDGEEVEAPFLTNFRFHLWEYLGCRLGFPHGSVVKGSTCQWRRRGFNSWLEKIPWRRKWQPTPVFLPGKSCGPRNQRVRHNLVAKITTECSCTRVVNNPHVSGDLGELWGPHIGSDAQYGSDCGLLSHTDPVGHRYVWPVALREESGTWMCLWDPLPFLPLPFPLSHCLPLGHSESQCSLNPSSVCLCSAVWLFWTAVNSPLWASE